MTEEVKKSLLTISKGASIIFIGLIIGSLFGILNQIIFARVLGPSDYGLLNLALSILSIIISLGSFGLIGSMPRFIPYYLEKGEKNTVASILSFTLKFTIVSSLVIGFIVFIFSDFISILFNNENLSPILKIFAISLPILIVPTILDATLRGFKGSKYKVLIYEIGLRVFTIIAFIPFFLIGKAFIGSVIAYIVGYGLVTIISLFVINKKFFPLLSNEYKKVKVGKKVLLFSLPLALTSLSYLFISKTDTILLGYFLTSESVGIYSVAITIVGMLSFIWVAFTWIFLPVISEHFTKNDMDTTESLFKSSSKWMFLMIIPILIFLILFSKELIILLFGSNYSSAYLPLVILSVGISMNMLTGLSGNMLIGKGNTKLNFLSELIGGITNISLNIFLIPAYGIIGAAIGTAISYFARNISSMVFVYILLKIHPFEKQHIKILFISIITFFIAYLIKNQLINIMGTLIGLLILGILIFFIYFTLIILLKCFDENDMYILNYVKKSIFSIFND